MANHPAHAESATIGACSGFRSMIAPVMTPKTNEAQGRIARPRSIHFFRSEAVGVADDGSIRTGLLQAGALGESAGVGFSAKQRAGGLRAAAHGGAVARAGAVDAAARRWIAGDVAFVGAAAVGAAARAVAA